MLKKSAIRRIITASLALVIVSLLYFFPSKNNFKEIKETINYIEPNLFPIYLLNKDNYIIRTTFVIKNNEPNEEIKQIISALTIGNNEDTINNKFTPIIPKNTKLLNYSLDKGLLKINFSKEFLNLKKEDEEKCLEALIYSLTEINDVNEIMIFIEDNKLNTLPQSKINLPNTLNRNYGINKIYDLDNIKNSSKTTIYYLGKEDDITYYIPITKIDNNSKNKIEIIIEELKSSPIYETNLMSYLASSTELLNYEILENQIKLTFNNDILSNLKENDILEEVKYSISLSLKDTLDAKKIIFEVNDKIITTFNEF